MFLISIIISILTIRSQILRPKYHNSSILIQGEQIKNTINPHEIFVHQVNITNSHYMFLFHATQKDTLFFEYQADNIEELQITESKLIQLLSNSQIFEPIILKGYSMARFTTNVAYLLENKNQIVLLIYCPLDVPCTYSITYVIEQFTQNYIGVYSLNILDNESFISAINTHYYLYLQLPGTDEHSITFNFNATCYTGLVDLYYFYVNYQPVDINRRYIANKEIVTFTAPANAMITIVVLCYQPNVVLFNYRFTEETIERLNVEYGITKMYSLDMDNKMLFKINKYDFDETYYLILNIRADNCYLQVETISSTSQVSYEKNDYHRIIIKDVDDYLINISANSADNPASGNLPCIFYMYNIQKGKDNEILTIQGVNYRDRLDKYNNIVLYSFPYIFGESTRSDALILTLSCNSRKDIYVSIYKHDTQYVLDDFYFNGKRNELIPLSSLRNRCELLVICYLTIRISNESEEDLFVDFKISATRYIPQYIPKNTLIMDTITDNFVRIFYSFISGSDAGRIKMLYQNQGLTFLYKFFPYNTTESHSIIVGGDDYKEIFFKGDELSYETGEECVNGCYAFIGIVNPVYKSYTKYLIFFDNNDQPVEALPNQKIKGNFYDKIKYTFRFTLNNISKFQIVLGGHNVKYQFVNIDQSVDCCSTFNETYYPEEGGAFIDNVIGDGTAKSTVTFDVIAISTVNNSLVSFYDITVLPFEYADYPIYQISDGETINCYTGKNNNKAYININSDFVSFYYTFSFNGIYPKNFVFYYKGTNYLYEEERYYIEYFINSKSPYSTNKTGIINKASANYRSFLFLVETEPDTKFTLHITPGFNEYYLVRNEPRLFIGSNNSTTEVMLFSTKDYKLTNDTFILEIEHIQGEGSIEFMNKNKIIGKKIFFLNSRELSIRDNFTLTNEGGILFANVHLYAQFLNDYKNVKLINHTTTSNYVFYENPFPLYFGIKLIGGVASLKLNLRLRNNLLVENTNYNFSNLLFTCFYTDKESYDNYNSHKGDLLVLKDISVHYMNQQPIINIEVTDQSDLHQYPYLIIKIEEKSTTSNWTYSEIQFDISPYIEYDYDESIKLTEKRYHYNTLNKQYQLYELQSNSPYVVIEFASCGSSNYQFAFSFLNHTALVADQIHFDSEYGKEIIWIENKEELPLLLNLSHSNNKSDNNYYIIKYSNNIQPYKSKHFYYDTPTIQYHPLDKTVETKWDTIKDNLKDNGTISAIYYHSLYKEGQSKNSICNSFSPFYFNKIDTVEYNWTNSSITVDTVESSVIAYFTLDDEDYLVAFPSVSVDIISPTHILYWVVAIFFVLFALLIYGTYLIYKEVKKNAFEMDNIEENEELDDKKSKIEW